MRALPSVALVPFVLALACAPQDGGTPQVFSTTPADLAATNLDAQIRGQVAAWERDPNPYRAQAAVDLLLARSHYTGRFSDYDLAADIAERTFEIYPDNVDSFALRSDVRAALHQFRQAREDLQQVAEGGRDVSARDAALALSLGEAPGEPVDLLVARANRIPTFQTLTAAATALVASGDFDAADAMFAAAAEGYRDVSPFPLAWIDFQRGLMWAESADDALRAIPFYRAAAARVPFYVVANVHLAELEFEMGLEDVAVGRLIDLVSAVEDPEPASRLAQFLADTNPQRAAEFAVIAGAKYEELLAKHPLAFADHASEYFASAGEDPSRAVELSLLNLENRPTDRAFQLALDAALAAEDTATLCTVYAQAESETRYSVNLLGLMAEVEPDCR